MQDTPNSTRNSGSIHSKEFILAIACVGLIGALFFLVFNIGMLNGYGLGAAAGDSTAAPVTYYVSVNNGSDTNNGTSVDTPFKTIMRAVNLTKPGDTVYIREGIYREQVTTQNRDGAPGKYIKYFAYQNEKPILTGADIVTGWVRHQGNIWKKENWPHNSQQVWVDFTGQESALKVIGDTGIPAGDIFRPITGSGVSDMFAGSFFSDKANNTLYVWLKDGGDPNNHTVEVAVRHDIFLGYHYIHAKGLTFRSNNSKAKFGQWCGVALGYDGITEDADIGYMDWCGVSVHTGGKIINSYIHHNGNVGVSSNGHDTLISGNRIQYNNTLGYISSGLGGLKLIPGYGGIIEKNLIANNYGVGLWIDSNFDPTIDAPWIPKVGYPVDIRYNIIRDNIRDFAGKAPQNNKDGLGVFYEISQNAKIHDNLFLGDQVSSIYIAGSDHNFIYNNTVTGNRSWSTVYIATPSTDPSRHILAYNAFLNNIVLNPSIGNNMLNLLNGYNYASVAHDNTSDYNIFYAIDRPDKVRFGANNASCCGTLFYTMADWRAFGGQDIHSIHADPKLSDNDPSNANGVKLLWNSPAIDAGTVIEGVVRVRDYFGNPIYGTPDIGAAEYQPPYQMPGSKPNTSANVRIYSDGKFRNKANPSGSEANIVFRPYGGYQSNYLQWLDLTITSWSDRKTYKLDIKDIGDNILTTNVGDLKPDTIYTVSVDGTDGSNITGTGYAGGVVKTNGSGVAAFNYSGTMNASHTFDVRETPGITPTPVGNDNPASIVNPPQVQRQSDQPRQVNLPPGQQQNPNQPQQQQQVVVNYANTAEILTTSEAVAASVVCKESKWTYKLSSTFRFTRSLEKGDTGDDVKALQYILARENMLDVSNITGEFDAATVSALDRFQKYYGIVVSKIEKMNGYGVLGTRTWQRINQAIARGKYVVNCGGSSVTAFVPAPVVTTPVVTYTPPPVTNYVPTYTRPPSINLNTKFTIPLKLGMTSPEVRRLQAFLNAKGFTVATSGAGSYGNESNYFGPTTKLALTRFQEFYAADILSPALLKKGTGYFGVLSMKKANSLLGLK